MGVYSKQIGWSQESILLYGVSKQLERLAGIIASTGGGGGGGSQDLQSVLNEGNSAIEQEIRIENTSDGESSAYIVANLGSGGRTSRLQYSKAPIEGQTVDSSGYFINADEGSLIIHHISMGIAGDTNRLLAFEMLPDEIVTQNSYHSEADTTLDTIFETRVMPTFFQLGSSNGLGDTRRINLKIDNTELDSDIQFPSTGGTLALTNQLTLDRVLTGGATSSQQFWIGEVNIQPSAVVIDSPGSDTFISISQDVFVYQNASADAMRLTYDGLSFSESNGDTTITLKRNPAQQDFTNYINLMPTIAGTLAVEGKTIANSVAPASATAAGTTGEIRVAAGFIYWCTAPNTWIRAAGATW